MQNLWGIPNLDVGVDNFYQNVIVKFNVQEVRPSEESPNVVVYFLNPTSGKVAGHIVYVTEIVDGQLHIITKDGVESVRKGVMSLDSNTDPLIQSYPAGIKYYKIDTNQIKPSLQKTAGQ